LSTRGLAGSLKTLSFQRRLSSRSDGGVQGLQE
jgi:hypothetical protein